MKAFIKSIPIISAMLISNSALAQRVVPTFVPFDTNGDGVLDDEELAQRAVLTGGALILSVYDLNGDGSVDPTVERLNFSQVSQNLRALTISDFPSFPILGIATGFEEFDLNGDGIIDRSEKAIPRREARAADRRAARRARRVEVRELAAEFNLTRSRVRELRDTLIENPWAPLVRSLEPFRFAFLARQDAAAAQEEADRAATIALVDFDQDGRLTFSEFLALPESRGILASSPDRLERNLQQLLGAFVRRDVNASLELELEEFTINTGDFLGR